MLGSPMLERVTVSGNSRGTHDGNVNCSTNTPVSTKKISGGTKDSSDATNIQIDKNISGPTANVAYNVIVSPTHLIPSDPTSAISKRFVNTAYGFFLGKRMAYPVVANYVRNTWCKYGLVKSTLNSSTRLFFFQFSSMDGLDSILENGPWFFVKLHGVHVTAFSEDGLSAIATKH
ncbi:putative ribonuclease H-like domain-containing protein, partial [Tanacetum coccineum]